MVPGMNTSDAAHSSGSAIPAASGSRIPVAGGAPASAASGSLPVGGSASPEGSRYGTLTVAAVPIGRPGDASPLLAQALAEAPLVAAEDTRRLRRLAATSASTVTGRVVSYFEATRPSAVRSLLDGAARGPGRSLLVTDAGMPSVSDPGYRLVRGRGRRGRPGHRSCPGRPP